ncbi:MAG: extracellular solute-binding protein [Chloroflexota bacterium]|nr:extracellular solute-binding protein [Chloroflexota bacterium]
MARPNTGAEPGATWRMKAVSLVGAAVLIVAGCAPSGVAPTSAPASGPPLASGQTAAPASGAAKPATLNLLYAAGEADVDAIKLAIPDFEKATGIKIKLDSQPYNALQQKVFAELAAKSSFYDIIVIDTPWMPALTKQIEPLTSYIENPAISDAKQLAIDDFIPKVFYDTAVYNRDQSQLEFTGSADKVDVAAIKSAGFEIYGLPIQANALTLTYRKDLFENPTEQAAFKAKYGRDLAVPKTWDDFTDVASFFTRPAARLYGTTLMAGTGDWSTDDFKTLLAGFGGNGKMVDGQFKRVFNSPEGIAALTYYSDLINKHKVTPPGVTSFSWDEAGSTYASGLTAMSMNYHNAKLNAGLAGATAYAQIPAGVATGPHFGTWMLSVNSFSKNKEWAYKAIEWFTSSAVQTKMLATQLHPTRRSVYEAAKTSPDVASFGNYYDILGKSLAVGVGRPRLTNYGEVDQIIWTAVNNVATGAATPTDALKDADAKVLDALKKVPYPAN